MEAQRLLEAYLEPVYSFISMAGADTLYPHDYLLYLWKLLLQNHPHDSICGCSKDVVHDNMEDRSRRLFETGYDLLESGLDFLTQHTGRKVIKDGEYVITLVNTIESKRGGVFNVDLQFPIEENVLGFRVVDAAGAEVPCTVLERKRTMRSVFSPINLPGTKDVDQFSAQLYVGEIPGLSVHTLRVIPDTQKPSAVTPRVMEKVQAASMENEHLKVTVGSNGEIELTRKADGSVFKDVLTLEETEDAGHSYQFLYSKNSQVFKLRDSKPAAITLKTSPYETTISVAWDWQLPAGYSHASETRSTKLVFNPVVIELSLRRNERFLRTTFTVDNRSHDHRIRAMVKTGIPSASHRSFIPFEVIERTNTGYAAGYRDGDEPTSGFVTASGAKAGFSMLTESIFEYQHREGNGGEFAFTIIRGNGTIHENVSIGTEYWQAPGNQCLRTITLAMALFPHSADTTDGAVMQVYRDFSIPLLVRYQAADIRKFTGGRRCVQDSSMTEIFYRPDAYQKVQLPGLQTFVTLTGEDIMLSAVKKSEDNKRYVVRVCNIGKKPSQFSLKFHTTLKKAALLQMDESTEQTLPCKGNATSPLTLRPGQISTIGFC